MLCCRLSFCQEFEHFRRYVALGHVHGRLRDDAACGFDDTSLSRLALAPRVVREVILFVPFFRHATIDSRARFWCPFGVLPGQPIGAPHGPGSQSVCHRGTRSFGWP